MWLFTQHGFYSVVHKDCAPDELTVRARVKKDIVQLMEVAGVKCPIKRTAKSDYQYRIVMKRHDFCRYLLEYSDGLKYDNFKNTIPRNDLQRRSAYTEIWSAGMRLDDRLGESSFWP